MTNREFFEAIKNGTMNEEVQTHATAEIEKMNAHNEKRATTPSKTAIANEPIKLKIIEFLTEKNEQILTSVIGEAVGISTAKASALCKQLADDGKIAGEEVKVPKIGKRMVWKIKAE
jgi:predicted transcriptional regulator